MSQNSKKILICFIIGFVLAIAVTFIHWPIEKVSETVDGVTKTHWSWYPDVPVAQKFCDGFFVSGMLLFCLGGLKFFRNKGTFDMLTYGVSYVLYVTFPTLNDRRPIEQRNEDYYGYTQRKQEERKPASDMLIAGAIHLGISVLLYLIYLLTKTN